MDSIEGPFKICNNESAVESICLSMWLFPARFSHSRTGTEKTLTDCYIQSEVSTQQVQKKGRVTRWLKVLATKGGKVIEMINKL